MLTVIANTMLREVILTQKLKEPAKILAALDTMLLQSFSKGDGKVGANDGFDIALIRLNKKSPTFAGAFRPLIFIREKELVEIQGDRYPIGFFFKKKTFHEHTVQIEPNDRFYLFSDGYTDQFGGERNKKFTKRKFKVGSKNLFGSKFSYFFRDNENF
jgi:serine phosphatase RsbU (regulator of sigma subunit)